ncbi:MAG TPA: NRDE family protein [Candidatus Binataceae bacterium]|nr:NRDE family protein [Candidatus Binataceae bacterium]
MCTLAIYYRVFPAYPIVVAANRDEYLERPALAPTTLGDHPHIVGGKDLRASGTWLGLNQHGMVAGLLNRRTADYGPANPNLRSRGLLCLDVLGYAEAAPAAEFVASQQGAAYNAFNLLIAGGDGAYVTYNRGGEIEVVKLTPGLHLLTNADVDDFECPRISHAYGRFAELGARADFARDPVALRDELGRLLADHSTQLDPRSGRPNALCMHLGSYGTRSSSLIFMGREGDTVEHFYAAGPPCTAPFERAAIPRQAAQD